MHTHNSHIVDLLINNVGIKRDELYKISGITSKRAFITEINLLLATGRIATLHERLVYSPRVLLLYEIDYRLQEVSCIYNLNYLPTEVLIKELGFITKVEEQEYSIEYALEIAGQEISEKHKHLFEKPNNIKLDFTRHKYFLWAKYLSMENKIAL